MTDRRLLDKQIRETIKGFAQVGSIIGAVKEGDNASKTQQLAGFLKQGKKIIISTVQEMRSSARPGSSELVPCATARPERQLRANNKPRTLLWVIIVPPKHKAHFP